MKRNLLRSAVLFLLVLSNSIAGFGQGSRPLSAYDSIDEKHRDNPQARDAWFMRGRSGVPGESPALLRYQALQQKLQIRKLRTAVRTAAAAPAITLSGAWIALGPAPLASDSGNGQDYSWVSGRATAIAIDPADAVGGVPTGNTVYIGGAHGGVWKSTNAASTSPAAVIWSPVLDYESTLAVGAIAIQPGNTDPTTSVVLVGTGEPNSSADSYYGLGILRSADGGNTWSLIPSAVTGQSFAGTGFSKIAFSTATTSLVVAASAAASTGISLGLDAGYPHNLGLYYSTDGGATWNFAAVRDSATTIAPGSATSVVYNAVAGTFFAAIRRHGIYASTDGQTWTRLTNQPGTTLTAANCPANPSSANCPIYRAELTVVPGRNEMYAWVVSLDNGGNEIDGGIWQTRNGGGSWTPIPDNSTTSPSISNCGDPDGCGVEQGTYNLELLALPSGSATDLYAGAINLYKCTINTPAANPSCSFLNLTHVYNGVCSPFAKVHPDQHHLAGTIVNGKELMYFANDGGIYRSLDGYTLSGAGTCGQTLQFDSLNQTLGSMTQFVSFSVHPTDPQTLLGGTQDNGSPATASATTSLEWGNVHPGDGGYNAITSNSPNDWFTSFPDVPPGGLEVDHCASGASCTALSFKQVISSTNLGNDDGEFYFPYILDPQAPVATLVGTCRIWRVTNATNPTNFIALSQDFEPNASTPCRGVEINLVRSIAAGGPKDANGFSKVIYAGTDGLGAIQTPVVTSVPTGGRVFVTKDASVASPVFTEVTGTINPGWNPVSSIAVDSSDVTGQTAYVTIMGFHVSHVWKTTNAGASWTDFSGTGMTQIPDSPANSVVVDSAAGAVYVGTDVGVFYSSTSSPSWIEVGPAASPSAHGFLPNLPVSALQIFNGGGQKLLRASTYGRGIWQFDLVTTPDYQIALSNTPLTVFAGQTGTFSGRLTAANGYDSAVNLSCSGSSLPNPCSPNPAQVTPGASFTVSAGTSSTPQDYSFNVHGVGTDASATTHDAPVVLHTLGVSAVSPASVAVPQGDTSPTIQFTVSSTGSFTGTVTLSCSGLPAGATCSFSPSNSVQPTSSSPVNVFLTIATLATTPAGTTAVTVSADTTGAPAAKTQFLGLTVTVPTSDYSLAITDSPQTSAVGTSATFHGALKTVNGYGSAVNLSCGTGAPPTCAISPTSVTPTASGAAFTVTVQSTLAQSYSFSVNGTGTDAVHVAHSFAVLFNAFTFTLSTSPTAQTVTAGQTAAYTLTTTPVGVTALPNNVTFACSNLPAAATCSFNPTLVQANGGQQSVTLSIVTAGAGAQAPLRPSARERRGPPFFLWVPALGLIVGGLGRRPRARRRVTTGLGVLLLIAAVSALPSCGGGSGGESNGSGGVTVSVTPMSWSLFPMQQKAFAASVSGTTNTAVMWSVNNTPGGNSTIGTIDNAGMYTAPAAVPNPPGVTVTAIAQADITKSGNASVTIKQPTPTGTYSVTVTATSGNIAQTTTVTLNVQ